MNIKDVKLSIENGSVGSEGLIFKSSDTYIPIQYIREISKIFSKDIKYVDELNQVVKSNSIFGNIEDENILIYICDSLDINVDVNDFCYIICKSCKNNEFIDVPKIESWQELDYAVTNSYKDIPVNRLKDLVESCNNNMFLLENELSKFTIFSKSDQLQIFNSLDKSNQLKRSYSDTIFDFTNAILDKNIDKVVDIYSNLENYDIDPMAVISIIRKQIRNIVVVGFSKNPTEENTGLSSKQIYWIRKNLYKYDGTDLINKFSFINEADLLLKKGTLTSKQLLDYVIVKLL